MEEVKKEPEFQFLGHTMEYWLELEKQAARLDVVNFIEELAKAHGKIGFYEKRIREMTTLMNLA